MSVSLDDIVYYRLRDIIDENNLLIEWNDNKMIIRNYEIMPYEQEEYELEESIEKQPNQEDDFVNEEDDKQNNFNLESNMLDKIDIIRN